MMQLFKFFYCENCDDAMLEPEYVDSITCPKCSKEMTHRGNIVLDTSRIKRLVIDMGLTNFRILAVPEELLEKIKK